MDALTALDHARRRKFFGRNGAPRSLVKIRASGIRPPPATNSATCAPELVDDGGGHGDRSPSSLRLRRAELDSPLIGQCGFDNPGRDRRQHLPPAGPRCSLKRYEHATPRSSTSSSSTRPGTSTSGRMPSSSPSSGVPGPRSCSRPASPRSTCPSPGGVDVISGSGFPEPGRPHPAARDLMTILGTKIEVKG